MAILLFFLRRFDGDGASEPKPAQSEMPAQDSATVPVGIQSVAQTNPPDQVPLPSASGRRVFADNNFRQPVQSDVHLKGSDTPTSTGATPGQIAQGLFFEKKYIQAIDSLRGIPSSDPEYYTAQITIGDAFFRLGRHFQAESAYLKVEETNDPNWTDRVDWNLLMTYLAQYPQKQTELEQLKAKIKRDLQHPVMRDGRMQKLEAAIAGWK
mgnify:CR=1 FL=1